MYLCIKIIIDGNCVRKITHNTIIFILQADNQSLLLLILLLLLLLSSSLLFITCTQSIYNCTYEAHHVCMVRDVAVLWLQSMERVMLFPMTNVWYFTLLLPLVCVQCLTWLFSAVPWWPAFHASPRYWRNDFEIIIIIIIVIIIYYHLHQSDLLLYCILLLQPKLRTPSLRTGGAEMP
jgi:hypothetical protein